MVKIHLVDSKKGFVGFVYFENVPRVGDEIRITDTTIYGVVRVVWCADERTDGMDRVNLEVLRVP